MVRVRSAPPRMVRSRRSPRSLRPEGLPPRLPPQVRNRNAPFRLDPPTKPLHTPDVLFPSRTSRDRHLASRPGVGRDRSDLGLAAGSRTPSSPLLVTDSHPLSRSLRPGRPGAGEPRGRSPRGRQGVGEPALGSRPCRRSHRSPSAVLRSSDPRRPPIGGIGFVIGRSTHSREEVEAARDEGIDQVFFGPVFATPGKGPSVGLEALARVSKLESRCWLWAASGPENVDAVIRANAGVAGIRCFLGSGANATANAIIAAHRNRQRNSIPPSETASGASGRAERSSG